MSQHSLSTEQLLSQTADAVTQINSLMAAVDDNKVNTVPYEGSWTAPQLLRHVTKSIDGMAHVMGKEGKAAERDPGEKIEQLQKIFLDFSTKLQQPDFIRPEERTYEKQAAINELNNAFNAYKESAAKANTNELVEGLPFGPTTKLELLHFVLYHTQRHLNQMKKICAALESK